MTHETWLAFFAASWAISLSPGAGALSCMTAGLRYGYRRAVWNILGLQFGMLLLVAIVAMGLGALLVASQLAFDAIKWFGVAYLVWLGVQQWRAEPRPLLADSNGEIVPARRRALVLRGFLVNASNPKGIVFMLAVLPQFIDPHASQAPQYLICAATLVAVDLIVMSGYALLASRVLAALRDPNHIRWTNRFFGTLFIGVGLLLAGFKRGAA
ncbi:LysE family transporter [Niveibacterium umoris]|uniref:Homoserine/homoserine lactone efflux protein n=1 Tax=Niveibacterium umoris TaxID=1193620 RepID=A0A840BMK7_9RHOO|nr:homoserine/homoserine lactone efflux protein [Niveibacterium umoris]MBB4014220.1 homoserine/homoserine lactone efflux protein [Niveibacterium umoris]